MTMNLFSKAKVAGEAFCKTVKKPDEKESKRRKGFARINSPLFEIANVLVRFNHAICFQVR